MPSSERPVFHTVDRPGSRPKCVFDRRTLVKQTFRTFEFPDMSAPQLEENMDALREAAAEARLDFERELDRRSEEAERRGREAGLQEAVAIHTEERAKLQERLEGAVEAFHQALERAEEVATKDALRLGLMVAERLTRYTLAKKPEALAASLVAAVGKMEGDGEVKVVASEDLAEALSGRTAEIMEELRVSGFEVEVDETLQPGDLMVFRGNVSLDARVATRIRKLERALLEELGFEGTAGGEG